MRWCLGGINAVVRTEESAALGTFDGVPILTSRAPTTRMPLIDYLLLTPLDEEWRSIKRVLAPKVEPLPKDAISYYLFTQPVDRPGVGQGEYLFVAASIGHRTPGQSQTGIFATHAIGHWQPARVLLMGIAGSLDPANLKLGDVVVPDEIFGYEVGDARGKSLTFRPTHHQTGALDLDRVRAFITDTDDYEAWQEECVAAAKKLLGRKKLEPPRVHIEPVASGNLVVKSVAFGRKLQSEISKKIQAVEMEAVGVWHAVYHDADCKKALMLRGISDYSDTGKAKLEKATKGAWRTYAAGNTARLLRAITRRGHAKPVSSPFDLDMSFGPFSRFRQSGIPRIDFKIIGAQDVSFQHLIMELTRFRGHFSMLVEREIHDAPRSSRVPAGIPAEADRAGRSRP